ncbi:TRAF-interacting protein with FHA domain-containing protein A [Megalops cyprinoides]|uniref:TRAF-interacting protein with FHA domain-containing protein A n=1 Tax=Megalops cyprinoides TaxID=118141 RepID=UPI001864C23A|nr:TRAF-interacting protein with FHA domain-containing protein A [Megalops cyprinoides]
MDSSQTAETEELLTCLYIQLYHPQQYSRPLYQLLPLGQRWKQPAEDPLRLGRDNKACTFALVDPRVSRKQLALQAFRSPRSSELLFQVQNLSQKARVAVNGAELDYLQWAELPAKALLRFGEYQLLVCREPGEAQGSFEVQFQVSRLPPCQELGDGVPCGTSVMDTGLSLPQPPPPPCSQIPLETDESIYLS